MVIQDMNLIVILMIVAYVLEIMKIKIVMESVLVMVLILMKMVFVMI